MLRKKLEVYNASRMKVGLLKFKHVDNSDNSSLTVIEINQITLILL